MERSESHSLPTPPQKRILELLSRRELAGQVPPTYREIAAELGWRAAGTVRDHVGSLVRKGFLSCSRLSRGIRLTDAGRAETIGAVPALPAAREDPLSHSAEAREAFRLLAPFFRKRRFPPGSVLWHKGEQANLVVAIDEGHVKIFRPLPDGRAAPIFIFGPGDLFGFLPFLDGKPYLASAVALDDVRAGTMAREGLLQAIRENPEVVFPLFAFLGRRLRDAFDRIEILSAHGVLTRVAGAMIKLLAEDAAEGTGVAHLPMQSGEFARTLGVTPESFSRAVTVLADMGLIRRLGRGRFQILEPRSLRSIGFPSGL